MEASAPDTFDAIPLLRKSFGPNTKEAFQEAVLNGMKAAGLPTNEVGYYDFSTVKFFNKLEQVKEITLSTFVIIGDGDQIIPPVSAIHLFKTMQDCNLSVIPYGGHAILLDAPDYICKIVADFLTLTERTGTSS